MTDRNCAIERWMTIVALDVGGSDGTAKAHGRLIEHLSPHWQINVISASLAQELRPRVSWDRVRVPGRPAPLRFVLFFCLGGLVLARRRKGIVHACGAIVPNRTDIISVHLCHTGLAGETGRLAPRGAPLVRRLNTALLRVISLLCEHWSYRPDRTRVLHTVSHGVAKELERYYRGVPIVVIPNGVDPIRADWSGNSSTLRKELCARSDSLVALFVGGDWDRKGLAVAIRALAVARPRSRDLVLWVVGPGDVARFATLAERLGVSSCVRFLGVRSDVSSLYASADVFVLPSRYETFSFAAHEAAAFGLPVLATAVHGVVDLIGEDEAGCILGSDPEEWARALLRLADDPGLRKQLGDEGRRRALQVSWDEAAARFDAVASKVLAGLDP